MFRFAVYAMVYLGAALMMINIFSFIQYARYIKGRKTWGKENSILYIPIVLLILFLIGYLAVGCFGSPDLIVAFILSGGSIFVFIIYKLLSGITRRILESEHLEAELLAAEESNRIRSRFLASISHEMRTPMNVILGLCRIALKNHDLPDNTREYLEKISCSGKHLSTLINNVLDLNQIESGVFVVKNEPFSLAELLTQINVIVEMLCDEKGLTYLPSVNKDVLGSYTGDEMLLKQVVLEILDNAVKYTDAPGSVMFSVRCTGIGQTVRTLAFTVEDTGVGMSQDYQEKLFDAFSKEDSSFTNRFEGSGLGLAAAKSKVELMGGTINVSSKKDLGSVFTVQIPLTFFEGEETPDVQSADLDSLEGRRILIVEDLDENAEIVSDLLDLEGAVSEHARNGQIAVDMFRQADVYYYDAVLMDLRMPVMDGLEAARQIRALARPDAKIVPILALTANAFESDIRHSLEAGMNAHLAKPVDSDLLYAALKQSISKAYVPVSDE